MTRTKYVISLQSTQGLSAPITFTVTGAKAEKILDLLNKDIVKHKKLTQTVSATLEPFFTDL